MGELEISVYRSVPTGRVGATLAVAQNVGLPQRLVQRKNVTILSFRGPLGPWESPGSM